MGDPFPIDGLPQWQRDQLISGREIALGAPSPELLETLEKRKVALAAYYAERAETLTSDHRAWMAKLPEGERGAFLEADEDGRERIIEAAAAERKRVKAEAKAKSEAAAAAKAEADAAAKEAAKADASK